MIQREVNVQYESLFVVNALFVWYFIIKINNLGIDWKKVLNLWGEKSINFKRFEGGGNK